MDDLFSKARNSRVIEGNIPSGLASKLTVFLGIYNGETYIPKIIQQLTAQIDQDFLIVAVDNNSQDSSWEKMQILPTLFPNRIKIVKNPFNLGAAGSLALSLDLIQTEWWCAFHQDDDYKSNYVKNFNRIIHDAKADVVSISAEMGSITNAGRKRAVPPRSSWLLKNLDSTSAIISNLRVQTVPFPATAFRTSVYKQCISPWHSTAFSDTESTIMMLEFGNFVFSKKNTMDYRENEMSESHSINSHESLLAMGASLARIFSSSAFLNVAKQVEPVDRVNFQVAIKNSVEIRLGSSEFSKFIEYLVAENCMIAWKYSEAGSIEQVRSYFNESGSAFTPQLLGRVLYFLDVEAEEYGNQQSDTTQNFLNSFFGLPNLNVNLKNKNLSWSRKLYSSIVKFFPYAMQKKVGRFLLRIRIYSNSNHPWNFRWK